MSPGNHLDVVEAATRTPGPRHSNVARIPICHIASGDRWAGAEIQIATLLRSLAKDEGLSLSVILLNEGRLAAEIRALGIALKVIAENQKGFLKIHHEGSRFLRDRGVQILHSHRYKENLLAVLLSRRCRIPVVVRTQHGLLEPHQGLRRLKQGSIHLVDWLIARWATDCVISVSGDMTRDLRRHIDPRKIVTIPNGVDTERVRSTLTSGEAKEKLGIERDCPVLGTAGRLEPIKRLDLFLRAAELISLEQPAARFVIAGNGSEEARLKNLARTLAIQDRVLFLGHRSDIADVLRALDVLVLCSDHEGLPMILLEALSLGVPVVARRVGGIPEVLQDGVNGVLVDSPHPAALAARCLEVLADESSRLRFAQAGVRLVLGNYAAAGTAAQVARLYRSLLQTE